MSNVILPELGIVFGTRRVLIKKCIDPIGKCTHCQETDLTFEVYKDYVHIFWIPVSRSGITTVKVTCYKCRKYDPWNPRVAHYLKTIKTPIYFYTGLLLLGICIGVIAVKARLEKKDADTKRSKTTVIQPHV